jgi:hypothetical protein
MRVLALTRYGTMAASTRQRFTQFFPHLAANGIEAELAPLLSDDWVRAIGEGGGGARTTLLRAYAARLGRLLTARRYDLVWISSELFPFLPGMFERLIRLSGRPYIVDYDDAIFHNYDSHGRPLVRRLLGRKLEPLLRGAAGVTCGNRYIQAYAGRLCKDVPILPTVVDTAIYRPAPTRPSRPVTIGWIGSPTTWANVAPLLPVLLDRATAHGAAITVVGAGSQADGVEGIRNLRWQEELEVPHIQAMDIGIMPLIDLPFQRGKCGYKLIQYGACGLPVVASPVGVNVEIVEEGRTGFLATEPTQWATALDRLIGDPALRARLGAAGRDRMVADYSLAAHRDTLLQAMRRAVQ